ncbi:MAG: class I SAM-dependent methyltransferase, partial [Alphaproteobacteria bacterium]
MTDTAEPIGERGSYWNEYYSKTRSAPLNPSHFAVFVHGEQTGSPFIVDIGCGSGRDTLFFASHGHATVGIDGSSAAIDFCRDQASQMDNPAQFEV